MAIVPGKLGFKMDGDFWIAPGTMWTIRDSVRRNCSGVRSTRVCRDVHDSSLGHVFVEMDDTTDPRWFADTKMLETVRDAVEYHRPAGGRFTLSFYSERNPLQGERRALFAELVLARDDDDYQPKPFRPAVRP